MIDIDYFELDRCFAALRQAEKAPSQGPAIRPAKSWVRMSGAF